MGYGKRAEQDGTRPAEAAGHAAIIVWDPFIRFFHWSLLAAAAVAAFSGFLGEASWIWWHVWAGTLAATLIGMRLVWGFLGGRHARFSGFVAGPGAVLSHIRELGTGKATRHTGHNPLGAMMILALIVTIAGLAATGALVLAGVLKSGPLAFAMTYADGRAAREIHEFLAFGLIGLVALHVGGALFESRRTGENLPRAMVTGVKEARPGDHMPPPVQARPWMAAMAGGLLVAGSASAIFTLSQKPPLGAVPVAMHAGYEAECGACHMAYPPSMLPAASWQVLFDGLPDHFGEDASLDADMTAELQDWAVGHSAETMDTRIANLVRNPDPSSPYAITAMAFWKRIHGELPDAVFASKAVGSRGNCAACHADARTGIFFPANISIPKEARP